MYSGALTFFKRREEKKCANMGHSELILESFKKVTEIYYALIINSAAREIH